MVLVPPLLRVPLALLVIWPTRLPKEIVWPIGACESGISIHFPASWVARRVAVPVFVK